MITVVTHILHIIHHVRLKKNHNPEQGLRLALSKGLKRADSPLPLLHLKTEANAAM